MLMTALLLSATCAAEPPSIDSVVTANSTFAIDFFKRLPKPEANVIMSPFGISECFAMVYAGAGGDTAQSMANVFRFSGTSNETLTSFGILHDAATTETLRIADSVWTTAAMPVRVSYTESIEDRLGGQSFEVDFADVAKVTKQMDAWVQHETRGLIPKAPGIVAPSDVLSLMNVVSFKADWASAFTKKATIQQPFSLLDGTKADVEMMHQTGQFKYANLELLEVLELPYSTGRISMVLLLPQKGVSLEALEKTLSVERIKEWIAALSMKETAVAMPKFTVMSELDLMPILHGMGMKGSDFSGIFTSGSAPISRAIQNAVVIVDETGTEAAAVTKVTLTRSLRRPAASFGANRPFVFLLRDTELGSIYFMGRVTDPRDRASR